MINEEKLLKEFIQALLLETSPIKAKQLRNIYKDESGENYSQELEEKLKQGLAAKKYTQFTHVISKELKNKVGLEKILSVIDEFNDLNLYNSLSKEEKISVGKGEVTLSFISDKITEYKEFKKRPENATTETRTECRNQIPTREGQDCQDFKVIHADDVWTVVHVKSTLGSLSWAVGLADGTEESYKVVNKKELGRVNWCTAVRSNQNLFDYYNSKYLMFYLIKNKGYDISDKHRRLCIAVKFISDNKPVIFLGENATVDANNHKFIPEDLVKRGEMSKDIISKILDESSLCVEDISKLSEEEIYEMILSGKYKRTRVILHNAVPDFIFKNKKIFEAYFHRLKDDVMHSMGDGEEEYKIYASFINDKRHDKDSVIYMLQNCFDISEFETIPQEVFEEICSNQKYKDLKREFASWEKLSTIEEGKFLEMLSQDLNPGIRHIIAHRRDLREFKDGILITQLAFDKNFDVRNAIRHNYDLHRSEREIYRNLRSLDDRLKKVDKEIVDTSLIKKFIKMFIK